MPTGAFVLLRFFLRIENVLFRSNETRVYLEFDKGYMLSEYFSRELPYEDIKKVLFHIIHSLYSDFINML